MSYEIEQIGEATQAIERHVYDLYEQIKELREEKNEYRKLIEENYDALEEFKKEIGIDPETILSIADIAAIKAAVQQVLDFTKVW